MKIYDLTCNYLVNPLGIDSPPVVGWKIKSESGGYLQKGYRILVSDDSEFSAKGIESGWDSGEVIKSESVQIPLPVEMISRKKYYWKVKVLDSEGAWSDYSPWGYFGFGILKQHGWGAKWISRFDNGTGMNTKFPVLQGEKQYVQRDPDSNSLSSPLFLKTFHVNNKIDSAVIHICGLGFYKLYINGQEVSTALTVPFTRYDKRVLYDTWDVSDFIKEGENNISILLGNGFYNSFAHDIWGFQEAVWRDHCKVIASLEIKDKSGNVQSVSTDSSWKATDSNIVFNGIRNGETIDARIQSTEKTNTIIDEKNLKNALISRPPGGKLVSNSMTMVDSVEEIYPKDIFETENGTMYDFGQIISGRIRVIAKAPSGTQIKVLYSQSLNSKNEPDMRMGHIVYTDDFQTDSFIFSERDTDSFEASFVYHGFRYAHIQPKNKKVELVEIKAVVVRNTMKQTGDFSCSNDAFNKLWGNAIWSLKTNYHFFPTDCPHREKNGWTGDAQVSCEQYLLNFNCASSLGKWMNDFKDAQHYSGQLPGFLPTPGSSYFWGCGPAWDCALFVIPWNIYLYYGDRNILESMYDNFISYLDYLDKCCDNFIVDIGLGDWCPPSDWELHRDCERTITDTAYYYYMATLTAKAAEVLGKNEDYEKYGVLSEHIKKAYQNKFFDNNGIPLNKSQTSLACALYFGLADRPKDVMDELKKEIKRCRGHFDCGILGMKFIANVLAESGDAELFHQMMTQKDYPSFFKQLERGATTLWEDWGGKSSLNHHMFSAFCDWFYKGLGG